MERTEPIKLHYATYASSFDLLLTGKYNILVGDSGSGKSELVDFAAKWERRRQQSRGTKALYGDVSTLLYNMEHKHDSVIVIDEGSQMELTPIMLDLMHRSDNYYILCRREALGKIPFGVDNIFKMTGPHRHRVMEFYFPATIMTRDVGSLKLILCEDSKSGFEVIRSFIKNVQVCSAEGKSNLYSQALSYSVKSTVIFDSCGIGADIWELADLVRRGKIVLFDCPSFEYEVLSSLFGETELFPQDKWTWYKSAESYYEQALKTIIYERCGLEYGKSNVQLMWVLGTGKGMVGNRFCDLSALGIVYKDLYKELREADIDRNAD